MGSLTLKFDSVEQLQLVAGFVDSVFSMYNESSYDTMESLNNKLMSMDHETALSVDLSKHEANCLNSMCAILSCIDVDSIIAGCNVSSKIARAIGPVNTTSCAFKFLAMLKNYHIPAEYCVELFSNWCSGEGFSVLAENCMDIQYKYNVDMIQVWRWLQTATIPSDTNWREEVTRFKEAINGCS